MTGPGDTYAVVYDGDCAVCSRFVRRLERWDDRGLLEIIPSQRHDVRTRFPWIPESDYAESLQLIRAGDGRTWQGAAAVEQLLAVLPRGRRISRVFSVPFVRTIADRLYRWFARNRYRLGCREHCQARRKGPTFGSKSGHGKS